MENSTDILATWKKEQGTLCREFGGRITIQMNQEETDLLREQKTLQRKGLQSSLDSASYTMQEILVHTQTQGIQQESQKERRFNGKTVHSEFKPLSHLSGIFQTVVLVELGGGNVKHANSQDSFALG